MTTTGTSTCRDFALAPSVTFRLLYLGDEIQDPLSPLIVKRNRKRLIGIFNHSLSHYALITLFDQQAVCEQLRQLRFMGTSPQSQTTLQFHRHNSSGRSDNPIRTSGKSVTRGVNILLLQRFEASSFGIDGDEIAGGKLRFSQAALGVASLIERPHRRSPSPATDKKGESAVRDKCRESQRRIDDEPPVIKRNREQFRKDVSALLAAPSHERLFTPVNLKVLRAIHFQHFLIEE